MKNVELENVKRMTIANEQSRKIKLTKQHSYKFS